MPWTHDRETGEVVGFAGPKMTAEDYDRKAEQAWEMDRYMVIEPWEMARVAAMYRKRAAELRAEHNTDRRSDE